MTTENKKHAVSRRNFVKGTFAGAVAGAGLLGGASMYGCAPKGEEGSTGAAAEETIAWSQCNVNCGGNCVFQWHSKDGKVVYMESDNTGDINLQARACLRGRSMRRWLNSPDRLLYPMKRVGKRGEGKFEQIGWDEAIQTIADKLRYTIDTYGNDAIYVNYATGMYSATGNPSSRLLNLLGGYLKRSYDYSTNMISAALPFMYGEECSPYDDVYASSMTEAEANSDLVVMFGNSPAETRMGGANIVWDFARVREAVQGRGGKIVNIDYRMNESASGHPEEWLPIRPGTDAALASAIAHEFIANDQVDKEFLDTYCVGYDEDTMPESAKGQNKSYKDYIMGTGYDMVEKTPSGLLKLLRSADTIRSLAADLASAEAPFVVQGWGPQRHTNGEDTCRAICMIPILLGKIGLPGTNTGQREAEPSVALVGGLPSGKNPVEACIPCYEWVNAVDHGKEMTAINAGVTGVEKLNNDIKFLWNYGGNCISNQHGDINYTHEVLSDESKCEFILVWDTVMTDSANTPTSCFPTPCVPSS
ncbi:MAG: molybdopterin-dependent oxidoreductase [Slackia sp.]